MARQLDVRFADRVIVLAVACYCLGAGYVLHRPDGRPGETPFDAMLPWLFLAAGLFTAALFLLLLPRRAHRRAELIALSWSGGLVVVTFATRVIALFVGAVQHTLTVSDMRAWLGAATWAMLALLLRTYWWRVLRPLVGARRYRG